MTKGTSIESTFDKNLSLKQNKATTDAITGHLELHEYLLDIRNCNYSRPVRQTCIFILKPPMTKQLSGIIKKNICCFR